MTGALFLNSLSISPNKSVKIIPKCEPNLRKKTSACVVSSVLVNKDHNNSNNNNAAVMDAGSLALSANGNGQTELVVKDLVPYKNGTAASSLVELQNGIGIVKFLRGKGVFVTGATGFLAKGTNADSHFPIPIS